MGKNIFLFFLDTMLLLFLALLLFFLCVPLFLGAEEENLFLGWLCYTADEIYIFFGFYTEKILCNHCFIE